MTYILGVNAYHGDSSACLLRDGQMIAAAEEERFRRIKHWAGVPTQAITYCLESAGITLSDVEHLAVNRDPNANWWPRVKHVLLQRPSLGKILTRLKSRRDMKGLDAELNAAFPEHPFKGTLHNIEHHRAHLASAALVSPFEKCVAVSVDQFGDFASAAWGLAEGPSVKVEGSVLYPHSLGTFYSALTQYIGFPHYGDEYKLMGLAPYGEPRYLEEMREILKTHDDGTFSLNLRFFRHHKEQVYFEWDGGVPRIEHLFTDALDTLLGPRRKKEDPLEKRHKDLARSVQRRYEEVFFHLLNTLHGRYGCDQLALAGGCAMNSVANGKVHQETPFTEIYVQSAAGDAGGAVGAAFATWHGVSSAPRQFVMNHALWGPDAVASEIDEVVANHAEAFSEAECTVTRMGDLKVLCDETARHVAAGHVVGWFQGRMEWGPRALGNRSIVCDPRRADMKDILNLKIKRRESFRPFAPSILRESVPDWFESDADVPFMMKVFKIREPRRGQIPAVTHVDGSGRLQTVSEDVNPRYYGLIKAFESRTGVPLVLNTSFNENEPVVCRPEEAVACFLRTKMDVLVLGDVLISRAAAQGEAD